MVAPASNADPEKVLRGVERLRALGHTLKLMPHVLTQAWPYFAATAEQRLEDLHAAFMDPEIDAVICIRGGYGSNYLLEGLDLELLRRHRKPFIGYSDHTAIGTWMLDQSGVPVLHGPMVAADFSRGDGVDLLSFAAALGGEAYRLGSESGLRTLQAGTARGVLYGGCLSLLTASLGTPFAAQTEGKLLFLEDLGEKPYQIDRMLRHMKLAGKFEGVTGIIFGEMLDCASPGAPADLIGASDFDGDGLVSGPYRLWASFGTRVAQQCYVADGSGGGVVRRCADCGVAGRRTRRDLPRGAMKIEAKHIHLIGICGTAMASLAGMLQAAGTSRDGLGCGGVSADERSAGGAGNSGDGAVCGDEPRAAARPGDRGQCDLARECGAGACAGSAHSVYARWRAVLHDEFLTGRESLVVAGTHGKTTTTSMLAWIYEVAARTHGRSLRRRF